MKTPIYLGCFLAALAVAAAGLLFPAAGQAQIQHRITKAKPSFEMQQTPQFNVSGPRDKRVIPLEWLEVEVELDVETVTKSGYIDQLEAEFFIGVKDDNKVGKPVPADRQDDLHRSPCQEKKPGSRPMSRPPPWPRPPARTKPSKADIQAFAIVINGPGLQTPVTESIGAQAEPPWWQSSALKREEGLILAKDKTPFGPAVVGSLSDDQRPKADFRRISGLAAGPAAGNISSHSMAVTIPYPDALPWFPDVVRRHLRGRQRRRA